jgi:NAD(P)-dependent dehydrogenase (short-subunit alcohol dehydrogenase family)
MRVIVIGATGTIGSFVVNLVSERHEVVKVGHEGQRLISMVNAGLEGFVRAAALELPRGFHINAVSPPWAIETLKTLGMDPAIGIPAEEVARAYVASVEGTGTGQILDPRNPAS